MLLNFEVTFMDHFTRFLFTGFMKVVMTALISKASIFNKQFKLKETLHALDEIGDNDKKKKNKTSIG